MTQLLPGLWAVTDIPKDAYDIAIVADPFAPGDVLSFSTISPVGFDWISLSLPDPGPYTILGWSDELTEEQAREAVDKQDIDGEIWYLDYEPIQTFSFETALESLSSLLRSKGITERTLLVQALT